MESYFNILDEPLAISQPGPSAQKRPLAMAYIENQDSIEPMYDEAKALEQGTLYKFLDKPFMATGGHFNDRT